MDDETAGASAAEKLARLRQKLAENGASAMVVSRLDSVAWLLNLRAADLDCTPFALAYCFVTATSATLFIDQSRLPEEATAALRAQGVGVDAYDRLLGTLTGYHHNRVILVDGSTNWAIYSALCQNPNFTVQMGEDPIPVSYTHLPHLRFCGIGSALSYTFPSGLSIFLDNL